MKFRKKPVVIEAVQWTGNNHREMWDFLTGKKEDYMTDYDDNFYIDHSKIEGGLVIRTLEGEHVASIEDWIIKGVNGEFYPCKPDIFEKTYEREENLIENITPFVNGEEMAKRGREFWENSEEHPAMQIFKAIANKPKEEQS